MTTILLSGILTLSAIISALPLKVSKDYNEIMGLFFFTHFMVQHVLEHVHEYETDNIQQFILYI